MASEPPVIADPDNPEWADEDFARARPAAVVVPAALFEALTRRPGRPKAEHPKRIVTIRLDADVINWFKARAQGAGHQSEIDSVLRRHVATIEKDRN